MYKTIKVLIIKFILTLAAALIAFSLFGNIFLSVLLMIAISGTVINYLIGDLILLPSFGNTTAAIGDGGLAAIIAYIITLNSYGYILSLVPFIIFAILIAGSEYFFHNYLIKRDALLPNIKEIAEENKPNFNFETSVDFDLNNHIDNNEENNTDDKKE